MLARIFIILIIALLLQSCSIQKLQQMQGAVKASPYEQIDFHSLIRRYMKKEKVYEVEGIYSVSADVRKRGKGFLSSTEKEKVMDHKENYAKVAVLRDSGASGREYIEISLTKERLASYSVIGEFNSTEGGSLLLYKHMEGSGKTSTYTFTTDTNSDIMEGVRVENDGNTTITYKLTYVKLSSSN